MTVLNAGQIATVARSAGFTGRDLAIAVAVCLAESGGKTDDINPINNADFGLWQINKVHADLLSSGSWSNPADNARMARAVWQSQGWSGWTTYTSGAYLVYMASATTAANSLSGTEIPVTDATLAGFHSTNNGSQKITGPEKVWVGKPPIDPATVTAPLSTMQRTSTRNWLMRVNNTESSKFHGDNVDNKAGLKTANDYIKKSSDTELIAGVKAFLTDFPHINSGYLTLADVQSSAFAGDNPDHVPTTPLDPSNIPNPLDSISAIGAALQSLLDLAKFLTDAHNWMRIAMFAAGGGLILFALDKLGGGVGKSIHSATKVAEVAAL